MQAANDNKLATVFHRTVLGFQATLGGRFQFADLSTSPTITWEGTCSALGVAKNNGIQIWSGRKRTSLTSGEKSYYDTSWR